MLYVPRVNVTDPSKPLWGLQTPLSHVIVKQATTLYTAKALTTNPFTSEED